MGRRHDYAKNGMIFAVFGTGSGMLYCDWRIHFSKNGYGFFCSLDLSFLQSSSYHHCQTTYLSVFCPQIDYSKRGSRLCTFYTLRARRFLVAMWTHFSFLHVGQNIFPIVCCTLLSVHYFFLLYLVD